MYIKDDNKMTIWLYLLHCLKNSIITDYLIYAAMRNLSNFTMSNNYGFFSRSVFDFVAPFFYCLCQCREILNPPHHLLKQGIFNTILAMQSKLYFEKTFFVCQSFMSIRLNAIVWMPLTLNSFILHLMHKLFFFNLYFQYMQFSSQFQGHQTYT